MKDLPYIAQPSLIDSVQHGGKIRYFRHHAHLIDAALLRGAMGENNVIKGTAEAVKGVVEAVPVYEDAVQPLAKQVGTALETVGKSVNVALAPLKLLIWGYERIEAYLNAAVSERLKDVPPERIITPDPAIAGPAVEALRFTAHDDTLRELYTELLATSMDSATAADAHPAFVEVIKQLTSDEAYIIKYLAEEGSAAVIDVEAGRSKDSGGYVWLRNFSNLGELAGCAAPEAIGTYIDNLCRLQLVEIPFGYVFRLDEHYDPVIVHSTVQRVCAVIERIPDRFAHIERKALFLTNFGAQFCNACGTPADTIRERVKRLEGIDILSKDD